MRHLFLAIHHPKPDHVDDLVAAMGRFGSTLGTIPGMVGASAWRDGERVVAISIWESRESFIVAGPTMAGASRRLRSRSGNSARESVHFDEVRDRRARLRSCSADFAVPRPQTTSLGLAIRPSSAVIAAERCGRSAHGRTGRPVPSSRAVGPPSARASLPSMTAARRAASLTAGTCRR